MQTHMPQRKSRNGKIGKIPVSMTERASCPPSCGLYNKGCYAKLHLIGEHWRKVTDHVMGTDWPTFLMHVAQLKIGQYWRHNQAGDLAGEGDLIDKAKLAALVEANKGRHGFTYTHKPMTVPNAMAVAHANANGFVVNLSADTLAQADMLADMAIAPVVVVLDAKEGVKGDTVTPAGRRVVTCPATYRDDITCGGGRVEGRDTKACLLCARVKRQTLIGFPAHGSQKKAAAAMARG